MLECVAAPFHACKTVVRDYIIDPVVRGSKNTATYIKNNWDVILYYLTAGALFIVTTGLMHGFSTVAFPLLLGVLCGAGFGIVGAIITKYLFDEKPKPKILPTLWGHIENQFKGKSFLFKIVATVVTAIVLLIIVNYLPLFSGIIAGVIIFNHFTAKVAYGESLTRCNPCSIPSLF